jgi:hypothetical protein
MAGGKEDHARARGEGLRAELLAKLRTDGPQSAAELDPKLPSDVSLSEVAFQLDRLAVEGQTVGEVGGVYRLLN